MKEKRDVSTITQAEEALFDRVIGGVWNSIVPDLGEMGDMDNEGAIECCLDANHPSTFMGEPGRQVEELMHQFDGRELNRFLSAKISLI